MVSRVFVDSSAWIAISDDADAEHSRARSHYRSVTRSTRLVSTNYVVAETYTWLRYRSSHRHATDFHRTLTGAIQIGLMDLEWISPERHNAGWALFSGFRDQVLSFTDCVSAVVARERAVDYVFSFDRDFSILGFDVRPGP